MSSIQEARETEGLIAFAFLLLYLASSPTTDKHLFSTLSSLTVEYCENTTDTNYCQDQKQRCGLHSSPSCLMPPYWLHGVQEETMYIQMGGGDKQNMALPLPLFYRIPKSSPMELTPSASLSLDYFSFHILPWDFSSFVSLVSRLVAVSRDSRMG